MDTFLITKSKKEAFESCCTRFTYPLQFPTAQSNQQATYDGAVLCASAGSVGEPGSNLFHGPLRTPRMTSQRSFMDSFLSKSSLSTIPFALLSRFLIFSFSALKKTPPRFFFFLHLALLLYLSFSPALIPIDSIHFFLIHFF